MGFCPVAADRRAVATPAPVPAAGQQTPAKTASRCAMRAPSELEAQQGALQRQARLSRLAASETLSCARWQRAVKLRLTGTGASPRLNDAVVPLASPRLSVGYSLASPRLCGGELTDCRRREGKTCSETTVRWDHSYTKGENGREEPASELYTMEWWADRLAQHGEHAVC